MGLRVLSQLNNPGVHLSGIESNVICLLPATNTTTLMTEYHRLWLNAGLRHLLSFGSHSADNGWPEASCTGINDSCRDFSMSLPKPYLFYWQRVHFPVRIVWTYLELDQDLRGQPNEERLTLWRNIMRSKNWRKEHICFWPVALHSKDGQLEPHPKVFFSLIHQIMPRYILCFGPKPREILKSYQEETGEGLPMNTQTLYLPGAEDMLPDNQDAKRHTWLQIKHLSF